MNEFLPGGWLFPRMAVDPRCHRQIHGFQATDKRTKIKQRGGENNNKKSDHSSCSDAVSFIRSKRTTPRLLSGVLSTQNYSMHYYSLVVTNQKKCQGLRGEIK